MESCGTWPEEIMTDTQNEASLKLSRRSFAVCTAAAVVGIAFNFRNGTDTVNAKSGAPKEVKLVEFSDTGQRGETVTQPMIVKSDAEWKQQLSPDAYLVTRQAGTERAFSGQYWNLHEKGIYRCICCPDPCYEPRWIVSSPKTSTPTILLDRR